MTIQIDKRIYSDDCISKAVYSLADKYVIKRSCLSEFLEQVKMTPKYLIANDIAEVELFERLNDYKLRCTIEKETHDIRIILYAKAFSDCEDIEETDLN